MTCLLQSYCTKGEGCDNHIGYDIEKCSAFKRKPLTRFEHLQTCSMEELAEIIFNMTLLDKYKLYDRMEAAEYEHGIGVGGKQEAMKWLKEEYHADDKQ